MRRLAAVILMLCLAACGPAAPKTPVARPSPVTQPGPTLACGSVPVKIAAIPAGAVEAGRFARVKSLSEPLEVKGQTWSLGEEELRVGVVCGVRSAERFAALVSRAGLVMHDGKPALHWETRGGVRHFMWLERPGTAVYIAATGGIAGQIAKIAAGVT
ncbi:hypothetical protein [Nonomuraea sp. LPB2021202275-12-8]|uniref:hypothetical protein n=1 Tax=Nonomuraea sp. LPB2021202275-12-8 TaxID=3120159 RepID=UPI00300DA70D